MRDAINPLLHAHQELLLRCLKLLAGIHLLLRGTTGSNRLIYSDWLTDHSKRLPLRHSNLELAQPCEPSIGWGIWIVRATSYGYDEGKGNDDKNRFFHVSGLRVIVGD